MAIQIINTGSTANAGDGDSLRTAFNKVNANFAYLGSSSGSGSRGYTGSTGTQGVIGFTGSRSTATGYTGSASTARDGGAASGMAAAGFRPTYYNPTTGEFVYASS